MNNGRVYHLNRENWEKTIKKGVVLVDFYADWCPPCVKLEPVLENIAEEYKGEVKVCKFNVDENEDIANEYYIQILPTIYLFKDGEVVGGIEGLANKESIKRIIENAL
ncbi:MAG: thioredoxin [Archaeoglobus sp.]|nr:thioredoxin [Archaeoglobus sp.]